MIRLVAKKVFHHILDLGYEGVAIPVRAKFEFEVRDGAFVPESLSVEHLYNKVALRNRYPNFNSERLDHDICKTVKQEIHNYLRDNGYLAGTDNSAGIL